MTKEEAETYIENILFYDGGHTAYFVKKIMGILESYASHEKEKEAVEFGIFLKTFLRYPKISEDNWFNSAGEIFTTQVLYKQYLNDKTK